jgi:hypothetical protein
MAFGTLVQVLRSDKYNDLGFLSNNNSVEQYGGSEFKLQ